MSVLTFLYACAAAMGSLLALLHIGVWLSDRSQTTFLLASIMAFGAGVVAGLELLMALASSPEAYLRAISLTVYPVCAIVVAMVWFVRLRLGAGRLWLAILISALWIGGMLLELLTPGVFMVESLEIKTRVTSWGESYTIGVLTSPWIKSLLLDLPTPLTAFFLADAGIQTFRRGAHRDAVLFGGSSLFFILVGGVHAVLVDFGTIQTPYMISLAFVAIAIALGLGLTSDVSRAATATRGLELQRQRWRALLNGVQLAAIRTDRTGRIVYLNEFMQDVLSRPFEDIVGLPLQDLAPPDRKADLTHILECAETNLLEPRATGAVLTSNDEVREFVFFNVRLTDSSGAFDGLVCLGEDITDSLKTSRELVRTRRDLERASRILSLGELAATLSHELSQPIGAVLSNVQSAEIIRKRDGKGEDEIDEIIADILNDTQRAAEIMGRIRSIASNASPTITRFAVGDAIGEVYDILGADADAKNITMVLERPETPVFIEASRIELQQVLMNLSLNAEQALTEAGIADKRLWIRWETHGKAVEICVDDNGPGLPDMDNADLFDAFSTTRSKGMGIGLAVSRGIIERHGGSIHATRSPAGGARFRLTVPVSQKGMSVAAQ